MERPADLFPFLEDPNISWKTWKLKPVANSSDDVEIQAMVTRSAEILGLSRASCASFGCQRAGAPLIWLTGDWMLGDAMTKRSAEIQFLKQRFWMLDAFI